ncbi:MAG TPA: AarF/UbiB family protein [Desulfohalobiaceae bacterium]|nr:AarF/UbiB family protein [Desulfohalobiaceae bacterium]
MDIHTISRLNRFKDIILTLIKYGFGDIISRLDLQEKIFLIQPKKVSVTQKNTWERIRLVFEDLGPTFIKFGQLLSLRSDLIPEALLFELSKLQDDVHPEEFPAIKSQIEKSLKSPLGDIFSDFDPEPLAAASLAQVHQAILKNEKKVVAVKVQRPGIRQLIKNDLDIMAGFARHIHERIEPSQVYNLPLLVEEIRKLLLSELNFEREARNIRLAQHNFKDFPTLYLPQVYPDYTSSRVLVMDLVKGIKLREAYKLSVKEKENLAKEGLKACLQQILVDGFFHADPHPGNIFILDNGQFSFLDWGMVGRLTPGTRFKLISLIEGFIEKDSELVMEVFLSLSQKNSLQQKDNLHRELIELLDDYHSIPIKDINIGQLLTSMTNIFFQYDIHLQSDLAIMIKAMVTSEGSARLLCPDLNIIDEAQPFIRELVLKKYSPGILWRQVKKNINNYWHLYKEMPNQVNQILNKVEHGQLSIGFEHKRLEGLQKTLSQIANRLTLGIITASMIIGSSMIITTGVAPFILGYPALGLIGYLFSAFFGGWLALDIIRKRRD